MNRDDAYACELSLRHVLKYTYAVYGFAYRFCRSTVCVPVSGVHRLYTALSLQLPGFRPLTPRSRGLARREA